MVLPSAAFASSGTRTEEPAEVSSNMERARTLFGEGGTAYELADYEKAIEKFEEAYALVVQANAPQKARSRIVLNLAYAHRKEYNLSANELNLRRARELLELEPPHVRVRRHLRCHRLRLAVGPQRDRAVCAICAEAKAREDARDVLVGEAAAPERVVRERSGPDGVGIR